MPDEVMKTCFAAIQQPAPLREDGNMAANWREWKAAFDYFIVASGKDSVSPKEKCALFMHVIGKHGREIYEEFDIISTEKDNFVKLIKTFDEHCDPKKNINYERHRFFEIYQNDNTLDKFLGALKIQSKCCEFEKLKDSLILTHIIRGLKDGQMREKLLAKSSLTLEEATRWCRAAERAGQQAVSCVSSRTGASGEAVERLWRAEGGRPSAGAGAASARAAERGNRRGHRGAGRGRHGPAASDSACGKCGYGHHASDRCRAYSVKCYRCDRIGHYAKCCRAQFARELRAQADDEDEYGEDECDDNGELLMYNISIYSTDGSCESWCANIDVNNVNVPFKLDSGADASVMSLRSYLKSGFDVNKIKQSNTVLREISKKLLPVVGYFDVLMKHNNNSCRQKVYVLDVNCNNLLGLQACVSLKLISRGEHLSVNNIEIDETIFTGIGCLPVKCEIQIDESVPPVVNATRKIPIKLRPRLDIELKQMEKLDIIVKEDGPTDWVSSIVVVEKPNKSLRVCLDPRNLNRAVKRSHFQLPTLDEIAGNIAGAKYFSKCDAKNGFWMLKLSERSSKLCTFSTPNGRYRFKRMPFGINCAPEIFHNEMHKIFKMEGVEVFIDDVLIWGRSKAEHDRRLKEVISRAIQNGVRFNKEKCVFGATEITFLGHTFNAQGIQPSDSRVRAIKDMPKPTDRKELERFLGVTNYLSRFIPRYSDISAPLRELLGKKVQFDWLKIHDTAYMRLIEKISSAPVLKYYSPHEPVTVSVDASSRGLGACLLQGGRPVAYAARKLTPTETRWAQIEKELLAIQFGCSRFHQYIYGHDKVIVENDHKPLEAIFKKPLNETPARLQRLMMKLQHYCIELQYKPGKLLFIADTLSRAAVEPGNENDTCRDVMVHVNMLYENVEATPKMLAKIKEETENDESMKKLIEHYRKGWPNNKRETDEAVRPYWNVHHELHSINGVLFRSDRVVVPATLRGEMLRRIHEGHLGVEKCQRRARDVMWWPGMAADIARVVLSCETCQRHRATGPREPLRPHALPELPWQVLATDIFELKGKHFLLVVDYYSKFVEIVPIPNLMSATVISALKGMFSRFGIPEKIVSDNGTQYSSMEFKAFCDSWEITHVTSSPHYPRSNGLAERNVRTVKALLIKAMESGQDWQLALLNFRNSPLTGEEHSPAQLLMGRRLNTRLPAARGALQPTAVDKATVEDDRMRKTQKSKMNYDRGTRRLPPLQPNDKVCMRNKSMWVKSKIVGTARGDRSYWVETENGGVYRRNRQHLMSVPQSGARIRPNTGVEWEHVNGSPPSQPAHRPPPSARAAQSPGPSQAPPAAPPAPGTYVTRSGRVVRPPSRINFH